MNILAIGNSFSQDATRYLHQIARADSVDLQVVNLYIGGCPLERHYRNMLADSASYSLEYNGQLTGFPVSIKQALLNREWDVVTLQQASPRSPYAETYFPYINALYDYVKQCAPKAKIVIHQTWAYEQGCPKLASLGFEDQKDMFAGIRDAYQQACDAVAADGIIPSGQLFQDLLAAGWEKVHRDTYHAGKGAPRYALALLWYRMLTGNSVAENTFCDFDEPVTSEQIHTAKTCVDAFTPLFAK